MTDVCVADSYIIGTYKTFHRHEKPFFSEHVFNIKFAGVFSQRGKTKQNDCVYLPLV